MIPDPYDNWDSPWARVQLDGGVYSLFHNDPADTDRMPRRAPVGFTAVIPPADPMVRVRDLSPEARLLAKSNGWKKRELMTKRTAAAYEKTVRLKNGDP